MPVHISYKPEQSIEWQDSGFIEPGEVGSFVDYSGYRPSRIAIHCHEEDQFALVYRLERHELKPSKENLTTHRILGKLAFAAIERRITTVERSRVRVRIEHLLSTE